MYVGKCLQIIIALVCVFAAQMSFAECSNDTLRIRHDRGTVKFSVELAQSPQEHAVGLINRESMPSGHGMLFYIPHPDPFISGCAIRSFLWIFFLSTQQG